MLVGSIAVALGACSGDRTAPDPASNVPNAATTTTAEPDSSTATTVTPPSIPATRPPPPPGSVTLSAFGVPLSEPGLRVLISAANGVVRVDVRGAASGSNGAVACPVAGPVTPPAATADCVPVRPGTPVDVTLTKGARGVLLRPPPGTNASGARLAEVAFTYVPADDSLTLVAPVLAASGELMFRLTPTGRGAFVLDADGRNGKGQLTLEAGPAAGGGSHVLASVGGGGRLRLSTSLDGASDAELVVRNLGPGDLPPLEIGLRWPSRR